MSDENVLDYRVSRLEDAVLKMDQAVDSIATSLQTLVKLEVHHAETLEKLKDHEGRLRELEKQAPVSRLTSSWLVAGVLGVCAMFGVALAQYVFVPKPAVPVSHAMIREEETNQ